jgi:hypothetical protein
LYTWITRRDFLNSIGVALLLISYIICDLKICSLLCLKLLNYLKANTLFVIKLLISFLLKAWKERPGLLIILFCYSFSNSFKSSFFLANKNDLSAVKYCLFLEPFKRSRPCFIWWSTVIVSSLVWSTVIVSFSG